MNIQSITKSHKVDNEQIYKVLFDNGLELHTRETPAEVRKRYHRLKPAELFIVGVTYDDVTPESAEVGDFEESGWERETQVYTLSEVLRLIEEYYVSENFQENSNSQSLYTSDSTTIDYSEGRERTYGVHIESTPKAMRRLNKILKAR